MVLPVRSPLLAALSRRWASAAFALSLGGCQVAAQLPPVTGGPSSTRAHSVIVQLFEWGWPDVAQECEAWLGPKGYGAVQISPPHEHSPAEKDSIFSWEQRYQPISYQLTSRSGNRDALADMVNRCHQAGVKIYVDMALKAGDITDAPQANDGGIMTTAIEAEVTGTGSDKVQAEIAAAMNELLALGVAGFRLADAQHIPPGHIAEILQRLHPLNPKFHVNGGQPFIYQAITQPSADGGKPSDYFGNGAVTELRYGRNLGEQIRHGQLKNLVLFGEAWGLIPSHKAVVFTDNHITQRSRDRNIVTFEAPEDNGASYRLANVFMLAWPYGTPKVMSSYDWSQAPGWGALPANDQEHTQPVSCGDGWVCEHRWPTITNMVQFRNVTQGATTVDHWWDNGDSQIAFSRGDRGFVAINREAQPLSTPLMTGLPPGQYCNILAVDRAETDVSEAPSPESANCSDVVEVSADGTAAIEVAPQQAMAIHIGARL